MQGMPVDLWSSTAFVEEARAWVADRVRPLGMTLTGEWEQPHCRPWSSAIRFESDGGRLWFKVNGPGTSYETGVVDRLSRLAPDLVPELLADDLERAWTLTRDAGPVMRSVAPPEELWGWWVGVLARYAEAQVRLAEHRATLLEAGAQDLSPNTLPDHARKLLDQLAGTPPEDGGLTRDEAASMEALLPEYDAWCEALAHSGVPDSVQHDDLHSSNVCWNGSVETARIIDWGDTYVGCPLATMLCTMNSIAWHAKREVDDPLVLRVRDAYLEPFTAFATRTELVEYVDLARRTGAVPRAISYQHAFEGEPRSAEEEMEWPVRGWFLEMREL
jgi:hypothetical protein